MKVLANVLQSLKQEISLQQEYGINTPKNNKTEQNFILVKEQRYTMIFGVILRLKLQNRWASKILRQPSILDIHYFKTAYDSIT